MKVKMNSCKTNLILAVLFESIPFLGSVVSLKTAGWEQSEETEKRLPIFLKERIKVLSCGGRVEHEIVSVSQRKDNTISGSISLT